MPGQTVLREACIELDALLQWRAGQLPGQTCRTTSDVTREELPSMEGRAIARPNRTPSPLACRSASAFNGGPGNCPAKHSRHCASRSKIAAFNGGPGNCPAKPRRSRQPPPRFEAFNGGPGNCPAKRGDEMETARRLIPSMEGRAIARPNTCGMCHADSTPSLQWRAGQLPGQTSISPLRTMTRSGLQWRAGQLPGQTSGEMRVRFIVDDALQWRAGQLPGQTTPASTRTDAPQPPFNGGPGNCPAKPTTATGPGT